MAPPTITITREELEYYRQYFSDLADLYRNEDLRLKIHFRRFDGVATPNEPPPATNTSEDYRDLLGYNLPTGRFKTTDNKIPLEARFQIWARSREAAYKFAQVLEYVGKGMIPEWRELLCIDTDSPQITVPLIALFTDNVKKQTATLVASEGCFIIRDPYRAGLRLIEGMLASITKQMPQATAGGTSQAIAPAATPINQTGQTASHTQQPSATVQTPAITAQPAVRGSQNSTNTPISDQSPTRGPVAAISQPITPATATGDGQPETRAKPAVPATPPKVKRAKKRRRTAGQRPLTELQRQALELYGHHKGSIKDIARDMGITHSTVYQHLQAAWRKLPDLAPQNRANPSVRAGRLPEDRRGQINLNDDNSDNAGGND